jgi:DNA-binding protein YbaB
MLEQMKQAKELYRLQKEMQKEKIEVEERGVKITANGKMEVERVELNSELSKEEQETALKNCFNKAMQKIQASLASKMQSIR